MLKYLNKYDKNTNNLNNIDKFILQNISQPIKTPYYIRQNIKKTIDILFSNNIK